MCARRAEQALGLVPRLLPFMHGVRIRDDSSASVEADGVPLAGGGADGNAEMAFAIKPEPSDCASVEAALMRLQLANDFERTLLRSTADGATGKTGAESLHVIHI